MIYILSTSARPLVVGPAGGAFTGKISPDAANPSAFFLAEYSQINEEQCLEIDNSIISDIKMEV